MPFAHPADRFLVRIVRRELARHNLQVLGFSFVTVLGSAVLWAVLYGFTYWLLLVGLSAIRGAEAQVSPAFPLAFSAIAGALLFASWLDRMATPNELPPDEKRAYEIFVDFVYAIPRTTLAIWGNISAWRSLSHRELLAAAELLTAMQRSGRVPLHEVPLAIPEERVREHVVFTLLLLRIIELRWDAGTPWLRLAPRGPVGDRLLGSASSDPRPPPFPRR